jgi:hypothetical protein
MVFLVLLLIPVLIGLVAWKISTKITTKEFLLQFGVQFMVAAISAVTVYYQDVADVEFLNGRLVKKEQDRVSCSHSYSCPPCTQTCDKDGKNCTETCSTCYDHDYDYNWNLYGSTGNVWTVPRIDRQGLNEPPRWTQAQVGDPTAETHSYTNYIKASPDSLFRRQGLIEKYKLTLPVHPEEIYDIHYVNRLVLAGVSVPDAAQWNADLMEANADLGAAKQVNMQVVLTNQPQEWFYALEEFWMGGKKNDVTLVIGLRGSEIQWATVMDWSDNKIFGIQTRDNIADLKVLNRNKVMKVLRTNVSAQFIRKPMHDFEYLEASITPTTTQWVVSIIIGLIIAIGMSIWLHKEDVFGEEGGSFRRR